MLRILLFLVIFLFFVPVKNVLADNEFITIVNPVRISSYTEDPVLSLQAEYAQIDDRDLTATWLLTYDVLENEQMFKAFSDFNKNQELGIFLEVTPNFAQDSQVHYNKTNSWHRATSLFVSGYTQEDRKKLIDKVFSKFKNNFGYYPKSVGAWWVDSYALSYMKEKYKITGVLGVADQYDLDGYQVWGTPYSTVYYPNKLNSAIPAATTKDKLDVVTYRWAARDPLNGYLSPTKSEGSLYSIQDYPKNGLNLSYYKDLVSLYSTRGDLNDFAQITLGLEADYEPEIYKSQFSDWMDDVVERQNSGKIVTNMKDFSEWYQDKYKKTSPITSIYSPDPLKESGDVIWINTNLYRMGIQIGEESQRIIDFRTYPQNFIEPYYLSPNKEFNLSVNLPYIVDSVIDKNSGVNLKSGKLLSSSRTDRRIELNFEKGKIIFSDSSVEFSGILVPKVINDSNLVNISGAKYKIISPKTEFSVGTEGIIFSDYYPRIPFAIKHRIERYQYFIAAGLVFSLLLAFIFLRKRISNKHAYFGLGILLIGLATYLLINVNTKYYISQTEADALSVLKRLPEGNTLVYNKDCIRCEFVTDYKPAAAAGIKSYVSKYSSQKTILDYDFQTAITSQDAKRILKEKNISYIYLPRYESYIESLPYGSQDLGLTRVYENANVQIWKVL